MNTLTESVRKQRLNRSRITKTVLEAKNTKWKVPKNMLPYCALQIIPCQPKNKTHINLISFIKVRIWQVL